jgi:hypothetical protein
MRKSIKGLNWSREDVQSAIMSSLMNYSLMSPQTNLSLGIEAGGQFGVLSVCDWRKKESPPLKPPNLNLGGNGSVLMES